MLEPRHGWVVGVVLCVELATGCFLRIASQRLSAQPTVAVKATENPELRERLIGTWQDNYRAKRTLILRNDGTATMHCELLGMHRLFAAELHFDEEWSLAGDQLTIRVLGGEPKSKIDFVKQLKGDVAHQTVLEATDSLLRVYDEGEATEFQWRRVTPASDKPIGYATVLRANVDQK